MQGWLKVNCKGCGAPLSSPVSFDTADMPESLQEAVNAVLLAHRRECVFYGELKEEAYVGDTYFYE